MPSIIQGYEYDIFISYRQKDNQSDQWVTKFIESLKEEINATFKEDISIYFDENPFDGLGESHDVDDSLAKKLKCLIFIPIISKTYCDPNSFAWTNEFLAFNEMASNDEYGLKVNLPNGNTASRVLPIRIHEIDDADKQLVENEIGILRSIDFVYQSAGVNRPLRANEDDPTANLNKTFYRDQINKVANAIQEIIAGLKNAGTETSEKEVSRSTTTTAAPSVKTKSKGKSKVLMASIGLLMILALVYFFYNKNDSGAIDEEIDKSIAVLPFTDMSQEGDQQYFADGVMEDILTQLQRMGELRVISRTSMEQYRNTTKDATEIGAELKVSYLLEGSIRKSEDQIMITAQLIRTGDDRHLWANSFTSEYTTKGLFDIQRQIAENIVGELKLKISPEKVAEITLAQTENKEAYEHFLRGRQLYYQANKTSNELAIEQLQLAIAKDAKYGAAFGGLSNAFIQRVIAYGYPEYWRDSAKVYATEGLGLDQNCAECYKALGLLAAGRSLKESIDYYEKAISINPNYIIALGNLTSVYFRTGDFKGALENIEKLRKIIGNNIASNLADLYLHVGNDEKARIFSEKSVQISKNFHSLSSLGRHLFNLKDNVRYQEVSEDMFRITGDSLRLKMDQLLIHWMQGNYQETIRRYELLKSDIPWWLNRPIVHSYFKVGKTKMARDLSEISIKEMLTNFNNNPDLIEGKWKFEFLASLYLMLGEQGKTLGYIERAVTAGYLHDISTDILYENLYNHPRFQELVEKQKKKREEVMALIATYNFPEPQDL